MVGNPASWAGADPARPSPGKGATGARGPGRPGRYASSEKGRSVSIPSSSMADWA
jgi:hypothetical protein